MPTVFRRAPYCHQSSDASLRCAERYTESFDSAEATGLTNLRWLNLSPIQPVHPGVRVYSGIPV